MISPPAEIGMVLAEVDTPALLVDLDPFERNLGAFDRQPGRGCGTGRLADAAEWGRPQPRAGARAARVRRWHICREAVRVRNGGPYAGIDTKVRFGVRVLRTEAEILEGTNTSRSPTTVTMAWRNRATVETIASGNWQSYFGAPAPLSSAYPLSYTFRNLGDGSIAKVQEGTEYRVNECQPAGGGSFMLDSFEASTAIWGAQPVVAPKSTPIEPQWRDPATPQRVFYGYMAVKHTNSGLTDPDWT